MCNVEAMAGRTASARAVVASCLAFEIRVVAELHAAGLARNERLGGPLADGIALVLGDGSEDVDRELCGGRIVHRDEVHLALHQG